MADGEKWEDFKYRYIETTWFHHDFRQKTALAMMRLCECIPDEILKGLPQDLLVFAPHGSFVDNYSGFPEPCTLMFLAPDLEDQGQEEVDYFVARLFASTHLKNYGWHEHNNFKTEVRNDSEEALVRQWGYEKPESWTET